MRRLLSLIISVIFVVACDQNMRDQERIDPLDRSELFADGQGARPHLRGTVPRGGARTDVAFYTGRKELPPEPDRTETLQPSPQQPASPLATYNREDYVDAFPFEVTRDVLERGREQFNTYCAPCHGRTGYGDGIIVKRGFSAPPSYHTERLRQDPPGRLFSVITEGYGNMYSYESRVKPRDRWAIAAYIRALQLSQSATLDDVPESERKGLLSRHDD